MYWIFGQLYDSEKASESIGVQEVLRMPRYRRGCQELHVPENTRNKGLCGVWFSESRG